MNPRMLKKVLVILIIVSFIIFIISVTKYIQNDYESKAHSNGVFIVKGRRKVKLGENDIRGWHKGNEVDDTKQDESLLLSASECSFSKGCPLNYSIDKNDSERQWYIKHFKHISPLTEWKKIQKYISKNEKMNETQRLNHELKTNIAKAEKTLLDSEPPFVYGDKIVIITPISNSKEKLENYFKLLCSFTYPHHLISVLLGEDSSQDGTFEEATAYVEVLKNCFKQVEVIQLLGRQMVPSGNSRHDHDYQLARRTHLAMARNQLISQGVRDNQWVLWIDVDIKLAPEDLIEHLLSCKKDIVTVNCLYKSGYNKTSVYDRNSWQETDLSRNNLAQKSPNFLMLEGYGDTDRKYLHDLRFEDQEYEEYIDDGYNDNSGENYDSDVDENVYENSQKISDMEEVETVHEKARKNLDDFKFEEIKSDISTNSSKKLTKTKRSISEKMSLKKSLENLKNSRNKKIKKKIQKPNLVVKLDGVGACVLLVKADLHRKGLNFPPFIYEHHIESEGLAKMASNVYGTSPYGLPNVFVIHW